MPKGQILSAFLVAEAEPEGLVEQAALVAALLAFTVQETMVPAQPEALAMQEAWELVLPAPNGAPLVPAVAQMVALPLEEELAVLVELVQTTLVVPVWLGALVIQRISLVNMAAAELEAQAVVVAVVVVQPV